MTKLQKNDVLLDLFNSSKLPDKNLNAINGGEVVWVEKLESATGTYYLKYHDDSSMTIHTQYGVMNDYEISHETLVANGDTA